MSSCLLPRDPALPQLAQALNDDAMTEHFAAELPGFALSCRVDRIKYRPRRNLAVSYRLQGRDPDGRPVDQRVAARFCGPGESARRHAKALDRPLHRTATGPRVTHDAALGMVSHWWPNDAKLAAATSLSNTAALRERWLPEVAAALCGPGTRVLGHHVSLAQVVPEHRLTARVGLQLDDGREVVVYAKADADKDGASTQALMQALHSSSAQARGALVTPRPLLWQPASGLHWQAALPGQALLDLAPQVDAATSARIGALLAELHATPAPCADAWTLEALRQRPREVADTLLQVDPAWTAPAQALARSLALQVSELAHCPQVTLHGDLHPRNLLQAADGALGLIDLDTARRGPALLDLGAWIADLLIRALLGGSDLAAALPACRAFTQAHAQVSGERAGERMLAWSVAYQLTCQRAWRCVVNLKPGRFAQTGRLLALAQQVLAAGNLDAVADPTPT